MNNFLNDDKEIGVYDARKTILNAPMWLWSRTKQCHDWKLKVLTQNKKSRDGGKINMKVKVLSFRWCKNGNRQKVEKTTIGQDSARGG